MKKAESQITWNSALKLNTFAFLKENQNDFVFYYRLDLTSFSVNSYARSFANSLESFATSKS